MRLDFYRFPKMDEKEYSDFKSLKEAQKKILDMMYSNSPGMERKDNNTLIDKEEDADKTAIYLSKKEADKENYDSKNKRELTEWEKEFQEARRRGDLKKIEELESVYPVGSDPNLTGYQNFIESLFNPVELATNVISGGVVAKLHKLPVGRTIADWATHGGLTLRKAIKKGVKELKVALRAKNLEKTIPVEKLKPINYTEYEYKIGNSIAEKNIPKMRIVNKKPDDSDKPVLHELIKNTITEVVSGKLKYLEEKRDKKDSKPLKAVIITDDFAQASQVIKKLSSHPELEVEEKVEMPKEEAGFKGFTFITNPDSKIKAEIQIHTRESFKKREPK